MNPSSLLGRVLALFLAVTALAVRADDPAPPTEGRVRAALTRSLDFLAREGDQWMNDRDCNACHHMPELIWSQREAQRRGLAIDGKKFAEIVEWTEERAKKAKASDESLAFLKLALPDTAAPEITKLIVDGQQADGTWKPGGQFAGGQRRGAPEATENAARLFLLALATQEADQPATEAARTKAAELIGKNEPAKSVETLVFRTLYARRFGPPEEAVARRGEILQLQHPDGGWGWMIGEALSDPLATGEVLYVLQQAPEASCADAIARGREWLLGSQREDGGWAIDITRISKNDRSAPEKAKSFKDATGIYTFFGSAWATIGLLQSLPLVKD